MMLQRITLPIRISGIVESRVDYLSMLELCFSYSCCIELPLNLPLRPSHCSWVDHTPRPPDNIRRQGHPSLALTLTGSCVPQPADCVHLLSFNSRARVPATKSVTIENPSEKTWFISPVLKGEHWQGAAQLQVPSL